MCSSAPHTGVGLGTTLQLGSTKIFFLQLLLELHMHTFYHNFYDNVQTSYLVYIFIYLFDTKLLQFLTNFENRSACMGTLWELMLVSLYACANEIAFVNHLLDLPVIVNYVTAIKIITFTCFAYRWRFPVYVSPLHNAVCLHDRASMVSNEISWQVYSYTIYLFIYL